jgi:hypothetical protein
LLSSSDIGCRDNYRCMTPQTANNRYGIQEWSKLSVSRSS